MPPAAHPNDGDDLAVRPPNTAITAANWGSTPQTQIDMAAMAKANPEMPCTRPATAAPTANTHICPIVSSKRTREGPRLGMKQTVYSGCRPSTGLRWT